VEGGGERRRSTTPEIECDSSISGDVEGGGRRRRSTTSTIEHNGPIFGAVVVVEGEGPHPPKLSATAQFQGL